MGHSQSLFNLTQAYSPRDCTLFYLSLWEGVDGGEGGERERERERVLIRTSLLLEINTFFILFSPLYHSSFAAFHFIFHL